MPMMIDALLIVIVFRHLALSSAVNGESQSVFFDTGNDDPIFGDRVVMEVAARSRLDCASMCKATCDCDAYTFAKGSPVTSSVKCRLYSGFRPAGNSSLVGARTFAKKKSAWLQKACSVTSDCPGCLTTCHVGQCLCKPAAYYSNGADVCVKSCELSDLRSTFLVYNDMDTAGVTYIDDYYQDVLDQCQADCVDHSECHAIVHGVGVPNLFSCWRVPSFATGETKDDDRWTLYKRTCA